MSRNVLKSTVNIFSEYSLYCNQKIDSWLLESINNWIMQRIYLAIFGSRYMYIFQLFWLCHRCKFTPVCIGNLADDSIFDKGKKVGLRMFLNNCYFSPQYNNVCWKCPLLSLQLIDFYHIRSRMACISRHGIWELNNLI